MILIKNQAVSAPQNTHYVFDVDISGSMYYTLPNLRTQLKNKLSTLIKDGDKLSIVVFSGKGDCTTVLDSFEINNATALSNAHVAIDRYVHPSGLTGFADPLERAVELVEKSNLQKALIFMTDGANNADSLSNVLSKLPAVAKTFDSVTFVEYGDYTDSKLIAQMAEETGGSVENARTFDDLIISIEKALGQQITGSKIEIESNDNYVFGLDSDNQIVVYKVTDGKVNVNANTVHIFSESLDTEVFNLTKELVLSCGYMQLGQIQHAETHIYTLGDETIIKQFNSSFGRNELLKVRQTLLDAIADPTTLYATAPRNPNYNPDPNAFCVMDALNALVNGDNFFLPKDKNFKYNLTGLARSTDVMTTEQAAHLATLKKKSEIDAYIASIQPLKFVNETKKVALNNLVFNSSKANVSLNVTYFGHVALPENKWNLEKYNTRQTRSYTVIKGGILNVDTLPCILDEVTLDLMLKHDCIVDCYVNEDMDKVVVLDLTLLPIINKGYTTDLNSEDFAKNMFALEQQKALQKVFKYYNKEANPNIVESDEELNAWLKQYGITSNGFAPKTANVESVDVYYSPKLDLKIKGLSALPSLDALQKKLDKKGKLNLADTLLKEALDAYGLSMKAVGGDTSVLKVMTEKVIVEKRKLEVAIARQVMGLIMSRGWFVDKADFDDTTTVVDFGGNYGQVQCDFKFFDEEIKI